MSERKVRIVKDILGHCYRSKDEHLFNCPKCKHHKAKLSVNFDKNVFKCWVCDYLGKDIGKLVYSYGKSSHKQTWNSIAGIVDFSEFQNKTEEIVKITLPKEFISLTGQDITPLSVPARMYLKSRGITKEDIMWWKIGFCPDGEFKERIIIPSFDEYGELNYFIARSYSSSEWMRYKNPQSERDFVFNELYLDWNKDITIVEGVFDAIVPRNAIPLLGSTLRENSYIFQKIIANCDKVYIALDDDAKSKEFKISDLFRLYGVDVYRIDTSGFGDVGEMDKKTFQARKKTASFLSLDDYLLERILFQ